MSITNLLTQSALIERATTTVSSAGDVSQIWNAVAVDVPCLLERQHTYTRLQPVGEVASTVTRAFFPEDTDLRPHAGQEDGDRITIDGVPYLVDAVDTIVGMRLKLRVATLVRVA